jgi:hypothetical protein
MHSITMFDSTKEHLQDILRGIREGKTQLPEFQRGWVWNDEHLRGPAHRSLPWQGSIPGC